MFIFLSVIEEMVNNLKRALGGSLTATQLKVFDELQILRQDIKAGRALANKPNHFTLHDVYHKGNVKHLRFKEPTEKAANRLIDLNWLSCKSSRAGNTAGRSHKTYYVNPEVYDLAENY